LLKWRNTRLHFADHNALSRHLESWFLSLDRTHWLIFDMRIPSWVAEKSRREVLPRHELRAHRVDGTLRSQRTGKNGEEKVFELSGCTSLMLDVAWCGWSSRDFGLHIGMRRLTKAVCAKKGGLPPTQPIVDRTSNSHDTHPALSGHFKQLALRELRAPAD